MTTRRVTWGRSGETPTQDLCTVTIRDGGLSLIGTVLGADGGVPVRTEYQVLADGAGLTTAVHVRHLHGFAHHARTLKRDPKGGWTVDGAPVAELKGCTDVDLGFSPATNTLPIRRLRLAVGASHTIKAAWVLVPALDVVVVAQTYTRLDEYTYGYASGEFEAELMVDDEGLVTSYAEWRRTGVASGPEDSEPLDASR